MPSTIRTLNARERGILHLIVREYIEYGEPVGSRTLSRMRDLALSPASIRNVMADLCDDGYLAQPHTSAGRIPTEKAFRDFVDGMPATPPGASAIAAADRQQIVAAIQNAETLEERVDAASRVLGQMTRNVGIVAALPRSSQELEHLELVGLSDQRVLMIVATRDHLVRNRVVRLDRQFTSDELTAIRNYVNVNFAGWTLEKARAELLRRIDEERAMYDAILQHIDVLCRKGLLVVDPDPHLAMDGASNLVGIDLHLTRERMRDLFQALEEKACVVSMLDRFLEASTGGVGIQIGLEEAHPAMSEFSLIGVTIDLPSGVRTRMAVFGPMRMNYERVAGAVSQIGAIFGSL